MSSHLKLFEIAMTTGAVPKAWYSPSLKNHRQFQRIFYPKKKLSTPFEVKKCMVYLGEKTFETVVERFLKDYFSVSHDD